jgi:undecaprenyl diphosphate synthase
LKSDPAFHQGLDTGRLPRHVAVIMDGNGRWAKKRLMNRINGHEKGSETVRAIVSAAREIGIGVLTLYAFSTENWARPELEVKALMTLLKRFLVGERGELMAKDIRLGLLGQMDRLPKDVQAELAATLALTRDNRSMVLNLALSYGGREEITRAARELARKVAAGQMTPEDITEESLSAHLYTRSLPDPDLLIRTSGEMRLSNFLLWQVAYAELFVTETLWPDFTREEFLDILKAYQSRERRFGKVVCTSNDGSQH